jgi:hypothetical protein
VTITASNLGNSFMTLLIKLALPCAPGIRLPSATTMRHIRTLLALPAVAVLGWTVPSAAQTAPSIDARTWRPSIDPAANMVLEPTVTPGPWLWNLGGWLSYAQNPVTLRDPTTGNVLARPVRNLLGVDIVAGVGLGSRASVGVDVPVFAWQDGTSGLPAGVVSGGRVPIAGLGDVSVRGKATVVSNDRKGQIFGFGLAMLGGLSLPTGNRSSFMGDGDVTADLRVLAEYSLGALAARASVGYVARTAQRPWPQGGGGTTFGDAIPWSVGLMLRPKAVFPSLDPDDRHTWEIAGHGALPAGPVAPFGLGSPGASVLSPVLFAVDDRIALGHDRDTYAVLGGEVGPDDAFGVPLVRAVLSFGWTPRSHDQDGDGVPDAVDECPDLPEDRDGIQDQDGCPEDDADGDGILDPQDACPTVPGVESSDPRRNGCPGPQPPAAAPTAPARTPAPAAPVPAAAPAPAPAPPRPTPPEPR